MQTRPRTIIVAGAATALLGLLLVFAYGRSVSGTSAEAAETTALVATADIAPGTPWQDARSSVEERTVTADARPVSAVDDPADLDGRRSVRAIQKGEVVTVSQFGLTEAAPAGGLEIPPGHNAVSVQLGVPQSVAGYVQPGDFVNIYTSFKGGQDAEPGTITKLLLSNIQVLANRPAGAEENSGGQLLTLALIPPDAEKVVFAAENGSLWLGLVHAGDEPAVTGGRTPLTILQ